VQCDQREPGCGQCEKRQQQCPGYRNLVDLMFRDESSHVIKKATKARSRRKTAATSQANSSSVSVANSVSPDPPDAVTRAKPSATPEPFTKTLALLTPNSSYNSSDPFDRWTVPLDADDDLPSPDEGTWPTTPMATLMYTLSPSFQERGTAYFFSRYVALDDNACHQKFDFVYEIWRPVSMLPERQVDGVMASMTAVGLAGLSTLTRCPTMMDWARRSYGTALCLTNYALKNPKEAIKDSTMLSVLILGMYEMMTGRSPQTVRAWQEHINGAAALAKVRGTSQFHTPGGIRMFLMLCRTVMISCLHRDVPMPQTLIDLRNELGKLIGTDDIGWRIPDPIFRALQVRYDIKTGALSDFDSKIEKLIGIDDEFVDIMSEFPASWQYRVVGISRPNPVLFGDYCHIYPGLVHATTWNGLRSVRMLVQETIMNELAKRYKKTPEEDIPMKYKLQYASSYRLIERLCDAILASIPQHFGVVSFKDSIPDEPIEESDSLSISMITAKNPPYHVVPSPASVDSSSSSPMSADSPTSPTDLGTPTLLDPMQLKGGDDDAERFMTLASASNTIVWPLYLLGFSSACTQEIKEHVIDRLLAIFRETGLEQANAVANMVRAKELSSPWLDTSLGYSPQQSDDLSAMPL
jgi:hypothetical protein